MGDLPDGGSYLIMEWVDMEDFAVFEPAAQALYEIPPLDLMKLPP